MLIRTKAHSGIFHMLPLANRVQQKIERLVDKHMTSVGASKVALSSITSESLWTQSGRLSGHGGELFKVKDRKKGGLMLSPTHEEEITALVATLIKSYKDVPLRLYQISRKYRDEQRPRQGLLRGREFTMKDLYTFDEDESKARITYDQVRAAYNAFFEELQLPYVVAEADSGSMGGNLSHEYHLISSKGEDNLIRCDTCRRTVNEELIIPEFHPLLMPVMENLDPKLAESNPDTYGQIESWWAVSKDKHILVQVMFPKYSLVTASDTQRARVRNTLHIPSVKAALPGIELDTGIEDGRSVWRGGFDSMQISLIDSRLPATRTGLPIDIKATHDNKRARSDGQNIMLTKPLPGDLCSMCKKGHVEILPAIEVGHTFYLGTRYSKPMNANIATVANSNQVTPVEMGCHGIGISRLIATIASIKSDERGLSWPAVIAPFSVAVVPLKGLEDQADKVIADLRSMNLDDGLDRLDILLDDRNKGIGWKLSDADMIGYPIIVVVGRSFKENGTVQVQCRQLSYKENVPAVEVSKTVRDLLAQL